MHGLWLLSAGLILGASFAAEGMTSSEGAAEVKNLRPGDLGMLATARLEGRIKERIYVALLEGGMPGDREVAGKGSVFVRVIGPGPRLGIEVGIRRSGAVRQGTAG